MPSDEALTYPALPARVAEVMRALIGAGHQAALVGGSVRDRIRGEEGTDGDWDAATSALPEDVAALFPAASWENRFGTVTVGGDPAVQVTSYRTEAGYRDRRRPDEVRFGATLADDLARRDFTINAIAWVPTDLDVGIGSVVDPFGGRADLDAGLLRTVGDPTERFEEDALRLVRAVRFAARFGLAIDPATEAAIRRLAPTVAGVSGERVRDELYRMLGGGVPPSNAMRLLEGLGLLEIILPELAGLRGVPQSKAVPGDALDHSLAAVDAAALDARQRPLVRIAALLHDLGKATTLSGGHFIGHEVVGAEMAEQVLARLRVPGADAERITHAIRHHMYAYDGAWTDAAVRRFIRRLEPIGAEILFALRRADNAASGVGPAGEENQAELERRIAAQLEGHPDLLRRNRLAIDGHALQRELGLPPGPRLGRILDRLLELVLDDPTRNRSDVLVDLARRVDAGGDPEEADG